MVMNTDRRVILALIAMGRITPAEAERLLAAWDESLETAWILAISLVMVCLAQLNVHSLVPTLMHFFNAQVPALAEAAPRRSPITGPITDLTPLTRVEGLL
jgi:hypothetical protein